MAWVDARYQGNPYAAPPARPVTRTVTTPPNYLALLQNDPTLQATLAQINAQGLINQGSLTGGQQQILGRLGETINPASLPEGIRSRLGNLGAALTPELAGIVQQANQSGVSQLSRLAHDYQQQQSATKGNLAARGLIHSGALGQHENENLRGYTLGQYDARQNALDSLAGLQQTYLGQQQQLTGQAGQAVGQAQQNVNSQIQAGMIGPTARTVTVNPVKPKPPAAPYQPGAFAGQVRRNQL